MLFGHCLGSMPAHAFAGLFGPEIDGCVLSGIIDEPSAIELAGGKLFAALGCLLNGPMKKAAMLDYGEYVAQVKQGRSSEEANSARFRTRKRDRSSYLAEHP